MQCTVGRVACPPPTYRHPSRYRLAVPSEHRSPASSVQIPNTQYPIPAAFVHGSTPTLEPAFQPRPITTNSNLTDLLYLTQEEFIAAFKGSPVKRAKRRGLLRNAALALAGRDDPEAIAALEHALNDPDELVRAAAMWALAHINERKL